MAHVPALLTSGAVTCSDGFGFRAFRCWQARGLSRTMKFSVLDRSRGVARACPFSITRVVDCRGVGPMARRGTASRCCDRSSSTCSLRCPTPATRAVAGIRWMGCWRSRSWRPRFRRLAMTLWGGAGVHGGAVLGQGWVARGVAPSGSRRTRRDSLPSPGSHHLDHQGILHPGPVREAAWVALLQPLPRRTGPAISPSTSALSYSSSPRTRRGLTRRNSHRWPSPFARLPLQELHRYYGPVRRRTDHARCAFPSSMREPQTRLMPPQCRTPLGQ